MISLSYTVHTHTHAHVDDCIFIRLEARLQPNIGFTLRRVLAVFTRSAVTLPKVNRFG